MVEDGLESRKILVMGDSFVGKTTFFKGLTNEGKSSDQVESTYGCDIFTLFHEGCWYDFYEIGGANLESEANRKLLSAEYSGYIFVFDSNNIKSLEVIPNFISQINNATGFIGESEYFC